MGFLFVWCFNSIACFHSNQEKRICSHRVLGIFTVASLAATTLQIVVVQPPLVSVGIIRTELFVTMCKLFKLLSMSAFTQCTLNLFALPES